MPKENGENKEKHFFQLSPEGSLTDIPVIGQGFYLLIIDHGWVTSVSQSFERNLSSFKSKLGRHMLIQLSDPQQIQIAREKFGSNKKYEPALVITSRHPAIWDPSRDADQGLKIGFGSLDSADEVPMYLDYIAEILNTEDFIKIAKWDARKRLLTQYLKKVPIIDVISLFA